MLRNQGVVEQVLRGRLTNQSLDPLDDQPYYSILTVYSNGAIAYAGNPIKNDFQINLLLL